MQEEEKNQTAPTSSVSTLVYIKLFILTLAILGGTLFIIYRDQHPTLSESSPKPIAQALEVPIPSIPAFTGKEDIVAYAQNTSEYVLGETTKVVDNAAETLADSIVDQVYENTIGLVILKLYESLPEDQRETTLEKICEATQSTICTIEKN